MSQIWRDWAYGQLGIRKIGYFSTKNVLCGLKSKGKNFLYYEIIWESKNLKTGRVHFLGLKLTTHISKSQIHLVPEFIDPVFAKKSQKRSFSVIENERFRLVFAKTSARNYRPCFRENQPKRSFSIKWKRAFWARENWVYKFGHWSINSGTGL